MSGESFASSTAGQELVEHRQRLRAVYQQRSWMSPARCRQNAEGKGCEASDWEGFKLERSSSGVSPKD